MQLGITCPVVFLLLEVLRVPNETLHEGVVGLVT